MSIVRQALRHIAQTLDRASIPYMVIGGQANLVYGQFRLTLDIDVTVGVSPFEPERLADAVFSQGYAAIDPDPIEFARRTHLLRAIDAPSEMKIDFALTNSYHESLAISRARPIEIEGHPVRFATPEDLVIFKINASRARDLEDVEGIVLKQPGLDHAEVFKWLTEYEQLIEKPLVDTYRSLLFRVGIDPGGVA